MTVVTENLKDVICERCGRVIGQRDGVLFVQFGMRAKFNKTSRIFCPFIGCDREQDFPVNRENKPSPKVKAEKFTK